jgi:hypothetical protein
VGEAARPRGAARPERGDPGSNGRSRHHLGFEVRVDLERDDGEQFAVQLTRDEAEQLELDGQIVYVRPTRERVF